MRIGIDLGGTKIEALALANDGRELGRHRVPTPREDYEGTLRTIAHLCARLEQQMGQRGSVPRNRDLPTVGVMTLPRGVLAAARVL